MRDKTPQEHPAGGPGDGTAPLAWRGCHRRAQVPALVCIRVSPSGPQKLYTILCRVLPSGAAGASQVLARLSSCMPRPVDSGGPFHPRQHGWSRVAFGMRSNPRRPQQAPFRSWTSTSGGAVTPAASRILCLRFVHLVRRVSTTPPWTQDSIRMNGSSLPDRDVHPARDAKLVLARERRASGAAESGSAADAGRRRLQRLVRPAT
jgi:hypothetical protein